MEAAPDLHRERQPHELLLNANPRSAMEGQFAAIVAWKPLLASRAAEPTKADRICELSVCLVG